MGKAKKKGMDFSKISMYDHIPGIKIELGKKQPAQPKPITCKVKESQSGTKLKY